MNIEVGHATSVGLRKENNEDAYFIDLERQVFVLCDGMGGHGGGDFASHLVSQHVGNSLIADVSERQAIHLAELELERNAQAGEGAPEMGTTLVSVRCYPNTMSTSIAWVGDSRAYSYDLQDGHLKQLTKDHSYIEAMIDHGMLTPEEAVNHPYKGVLAQAIGGGKSFAKPEVITHQFKPNSILLLASDGLTNEISNEQIGFLLRQSIDIQDLADLFVSEANRRGGRDNITVILIRKV